MKKTLILCGALLALTASVASAGGLNLSWGDCGALGTQNQNFACTSNTGSPPFFIYASFEPNAPTTQLVAIDCVIDLQSTLATLPAWWSNSCPAPPATNLRNMTASADFTAGPFNCADPWSGAASGGVAGYGVGFGGPNRARMIVSESVDFNAPVAVAPGSEYYGFRVLIPRTGTVGSPSCAGCQDPVCIVLNNVKEGLQDGSTADLNSPLARNFVTWQGGAIGGAGCPGATPTRNSTWGQVKSLYR